jgi:hypothetical protein
MNSESAQSTDPNAEARAQLATVLLWKLEPAGDRWRLAHPITGATIATFEHRHDALAALDVFRLAEDLDAEADDLRGETESLGQRCEELAAEIKAIRAELQAKAGKGARRLVTEQRPNGRAL